MTELNPDTLLAVFARDPEACSMMRKAGEGITKSLNEQGPDQVLLNLASLLCTALGHLTEVCDRLHDKMTDEERTQALASVDMLAGVALGLSAIHCKVPDGLGHAIGDGYKAINLVRDFNLPLVPISQAKTIVPMLAHVCNAVADKHDHPIIIADRVH